MTDPLGNEAVWRLAAFLICFGFLFLLQVWGAGWARRGSYWPRGLWNLVFAALGALTLRLAFPFLAVGAAFWAEARQIGLLNWVGAPLWLALPATIILMDAAVWAQHRLMHRLPLLWRLHRMHHADHDIDVTTGLRFHPFEAVFSMAFKMAVVIILGTPAIAVLMFEIILNAASLFEHANLRISERWDARLRRFIVTPAMHRVHHTWHKDEQNSNFGFFLSIWDRLAGTYIAQSRDGADPRLGLASTRGPQGFFAMLSDPFHADAITKTVSNPRTVSRL